MLRAIAGADPICSGCCEDGVDAVAEAALEVVAVHAVLGLDVADDGLDSRTTLHLAPEEP